MPKPLKIRIDSRLRLPAGAPTELVAALQKAFTHRNPEYYRKQNMGFDPDFAGLPKEIPTWRIDATTGEFSLPRGGTSTLRELLPPLGYLPVWDDHRVTLEPVQWPSFQTKTLYEHQQEALAECIKTEQGIVRAPTGGGKTILAFAAAMAFRQPTLVVMRDSNLLDQWLGVAVKELGMAEKEIGVLTGSRTLRFGHRLTLGMQQTLASDKFPIEEVNKRIGAVLVDEAQGVAARTFIKFIDQVESKYRIGFSADETRKDGKEFLTYDLFGRVLYTIPREALEQAGVVLPVTVRLVPTDFRADWYRDADAKSGDKDFGELLEQMMADEAREQQLIDLLQSLVEHKQTPLFTFSQRKEHARRIADEYLPEVGIKAGLLLGGPEHRTRFREDKDRLLSGLIPVAAGTFQALGVGHDVPQVRCGVIALPLGNNRQFFGQVRGRVCRSAPGKDDAFLYMLWDRHVFPYIAKKVAEWNGGNTEVWNGEKWEPVKV